MMMTMMMIIVTIINCDRFSVPYAELQREVTRVTYSSNN